jgi:hypothetical protein
VNAKERVGGLDHCQHLGRADRDAALGFEFVDDLADEPDMIRAFRFRQRDRLHPRADDRFEVAHGHAHRPVEPHDDIGAAARHDLGRLGHERSRPLLLRGGDAVLKVENDRIGASPSCAIDKAALRRRHKQ